MSSHYNVCSFCGCGEEEVDKLISSPDDTVAICNDCVGICVEVLEEAENTPVGLLH